MERFFTRYSSQPISQGVTLLFFFTEKKKRSKKRKEFAFHLYYKVKYHTKITRQQNFPDRLTRRTNNTTPIANSTMPATSTAVVRAVIVPVTTA